MNKIAKIGKNEELTAIYNYLAVEPELNLFILSDLQNFGLDKDYQDLWIEKREEEIVSLLLRYHNNFLPYSHISDYSTSWMVNIIQKHRPFEMLVGAKRFVQPLFEAGGWEMKVNNGFFAACSRLEPVALSDLPFPSKWCTIDDVQDIINLYSQIEEFGNSATSRASITEKFKTNTGKTILVYDQGQPIAAASSTAENQFAGMVVGVATLPNYRGRGMASNLVYSLTEKLLAEGKRCCLFYDNPTAGLIYKRLGYKDKADWLLCSIKHG